MNPRPFSHDLIASDAFEMMIENAIVRADDLYDLDGETFLQRRNGRIETFDAEYADFGGAPCR